MHPNEPLAPEAPRGRFRKLRISWSVGWGLLAVLLITLWVRSYWYMDEVRNASSWVTQLASYRGGIHYYRGPTFLSPGDRWLFLVTPHRDIDDDARMTFALSLGSLLRGHQWLIVPYCFLVAVCGVIAAAPWLRWRFSLRTLLIATTLVAVGLGLIV
jgi:hypothetical protein